MRICFGCGEPYYFDQLHCIECKAKKVKPKSDEAVDAVIAALDAMGPAVKHCWMCNAVLCDGCDGCNHHSHQCICIDKLPLAEVLSYRSKPQSWNLSSASLTKVPSVFHRVLKFIDPVRIINLLDKE